MAADRRPHVRDKLAPQLGLPPPYRLITLREVGDAFRHTQRIAAQEGAGTIVWVRRFDLVEFAVVLEPDEPLAAARRSIYAGLAALGDALASHAPPETLISFEWPDAIFVGGGLVGGVQLAWPVGDEKARPDWLVFGATLRAAGLGTEEPGLRPQSAALEDEGFDDLAPGRLIASFARHFMVLVDAWQQEGFTPVMESYLARLPADERLERTIDGAGNLLIRPKGKVQVEKRQLVPALAPVSWFDPETRGPRL
jgi:biotin-(acetyl-CoA carboxylase) ligase